MKIEEIIDIIRKETAEGANTKERIADTFDAVVAYFDNILSKGGLVQIKTGTIATATPGSPAEASVQYDEQSKTATLYFTIPVGDKGNNGKNIEIQAGTTHIQWQLENDAQWNDLIEISELKGGNGITPNFQIGEVTTIESTAEATATITGTPEDPLLNLWLPKGKDGENNGSGEEITAPEIGDNGNWIIGGEDTGKPSRGENGITPNLQIGEVTTVESMAEATATITGTPEEPMLNLWLPRGKDGENNGDWENNNGTGLPTGWNPYDFLVIGNDGNPMWLPGLRTYQEDMFKQITEYAKKCIIQFEVPDGNAILQLNNLQPIFENMQDMTIIIWNNKPIFHLHIDCEDEEIIWQENQATMINLLGKGAIELYLKPIYTNWGMKVLTSVKKYKI